ncbi:hypothetical protein [Oxalobacter paraformigenes]|nr:hypothetical protein [Oxalobacter paraformigenes]
MFQHPAPGFPLCLVRPVSPMREFYIQFPPSPIAWRENLFTVQHRVFPDGNKPLPAFFRLPDSGSQADTVSGTGAPVPETVSAFSFRRPFHPVF